MRERENILTLSEFHKRMLHVIITPSFSKKKTLIYIIHPHTCLTKLICKWYVQNKGHKERKSLKKDNHGRYKKRNKEKDTDRQLKCDVCITKLCNLCYSIRIFYL